eukprot:13621594-Ditylum_brightwellii.AAC.1
MVEVQNQRITNEQVYQLFLIDPIQEIAISRQLRWIRKIAMMNESQLPRKFVNAWHPNPRPVGCPLTTTRHTYLHALRVAEVISEDDKQGKLKNWMPTIHQDPIGWDKWRLEITPNLAGYVPPPPTL